MKANRRSDGGVPSTPSSATSPVDAVAGLRDSVAALYNGNFARFRSRLRRRFVRRGPNGLSTEDIDDAIHEAFLRVLGLQNAGVLELRTPAAYILATARNSCFDMIRSRKRRRDATATLSSPDPAGDAGGAADTHLASARALESYVKRLPQELMRLYSLRYVEGLSQRDCAVALATSRKRVRTLEATFVEGLHEHITSLQRGGSRRAEGTETATAHVAYENSLHLTR